MALAAATLLGLAAAAPAAMACPGSPSAYSQQVQGQAGVAGYWRLNEPSGTVACASAGTQAGAYVAGVALASPSLLADADAAVTLDGATGTVRIPDAPDLRVASTLTLEAWISLDTLPPAGGNERVIDKGGSYALRVNDNGAVQFTTFSGTTGRSVQTAAGTVAAGRTYALAATYDGASMRVYVNGALKASGAATGAVANFTSPLYLGTYGGNQRYLDGTLDEVAVYSSALSAGDLAGHYSAGTTSGPTNAPPTAPTGLVASAGDGAVTLTWGASSDSDLAGYRVYRRNADGTWPSAALDATGAATTTYQDRSAAAGTTYTYRVTAVDAAGQASPPSNEASATAASDPVVAAAGDIACAPTSTSYNGGAGTSTACQQRAVSDLLVGAGLSAVLPLGDNQYADGALANFRQVFDPTWGRANAIAHPVTGNHEYDQTGAQGYFDYFNGVGNATGRGGERGKGYYSFDIGAWHLVALNSNCAAVGGCGAGSAQETWLKADLAANPRRCTIAYWHHPRFNSGSAGTASSTGAFWTDLYNAGADVVLNGHDHHYERFAPQTPTAAADASRGIREFIVGTGGASHHALTTTSFAANSQVRDDKTFGVLKLTLHAGSYDWRFAPVAGKTYTDSGTTACH